MSAWWLIAPGVLGCLAVLVTAAKLSAPKPRHAAPRGLAGPEASITLPPAPPPAGSVILAEERGLYWPAPSRWEVTHEDGPDWREQTAADLAPEALGWPDSQVTTDGSAPGWLGANLSGCHPWPGPEEVVPDGGLASDRAPVSPGPGAGSSSLMAPGPDPLPEYWAAQDRGENPAFPWREPTRLADTGDIFLAHLLADGQAYMRAQDAGAVAHVAGLRADLTAALA